MNQTTINQLDTTKCPDSKNMKIKTNSEKTIQHHNKLDRALFIN